MRSRDMCAYCEHIDDQIARSRFFHHRINDQQTLDSLERIIQELEAEKKALHPDETGGNN